MIELALFLQVVVWLAVWGIFLASGQASIFHPATYYLAFHGVVFVLRPLLVYFLDFHSVWDYMQLEPDEGTFVSTLAVTSVGLVVLTGMCLCVGKTPPQFDAESAPLVSALQLRALQWTILILSPLIAYSIYSTRGGAETSGERAANGVFIQTHSTGYINDAQFFVAPILCAWLLATQFRWHNLLPIALYVGYRSYVGWSRWTILLFFAMVVIEFCWYRRLRWLPVWTLAVAIPVLMLFNILGHNRDLVKSYLTGKMVDATQLADQLGIRPGMSEIERRDLRYDTQDFANFDYLTAYVALVPKRTGIYTYGSQYLQLFTEPIPRILWPGKPTGAPVKTFNLLDYGNFIGLTLSLVGDGWVSGGWIGVIITMGMAGFILGLAHRWFWRNCSKPILPLFYITFLGITPNWFRDGGISVTKFILFTWLPLLVWVGVIWWFDQRRIHGTSIILRPGDSLRILQREQSGRSDDSVTRSFLLVHPNVRNSWAIKSDPRRDGNE